MSVYLPQVCGEDVVSELLLGDSLAIRHVRDLVSRVAPIDLPVLIQGPTGSGKELVARALHAASGRAGRFVAFNICAIPESLFEATLFGHVRGAYTGATRDAPGHLREADQGTAFADEISGLTLALQPKLLRAVEAREYRPMGASRDCKSDFRLISATNEDLASLVTAHRFRSDLAERLSTFVIDVPPLAARPDDIPILVEHFITRSPVNSMGRRISVSQAAIHVLQAYAWPHNVRELRNVVDRALVYAGPAATLLSSETVAAVIRRPNGATGGARVTEDPSRRRLMSVLEACDWKIGKTAEALGVDRTTVYRWMRRLGVHRPMARERRAPLGE